MPIIGQPSPSCISRSLSSSQNKTLYLLTIAPHPTLTLTPLPLLVTSIYFVFFNSTILDISYKWIYQILLHNVFKVFPYGNIYQNFLPFQDQITFSCMDMPHSFIHPSFDGLLSFLFVCCTYCCHIQSINAHSSSKVNLLYIYLGVEFLDHTIILIHCFRNDILFFRISVISSAIDSTNNVNNAQLLLWFLSL